MRPLVLSVALVLGAAALVAQDAVKTLPNNYKVTLENEFMRVTHVHYGPREKLPGHTHTSLPSAYVYLNDGGPVSFKHIGLEYGAVTRPATVARSFRVFRGLEEIHEVENLSDTPSDFLRVEFKTDPGPEPRTLRGKFLPPAATTDVVQKVEFENAQLRVTRLVAPNGRTVLAAPGPRPSVLISLSNHDLGHATWLAKDTALTLDGTTRPAEALRFELKSDVRPTR